MKNPAVMPDGPEANTAGCKCPVTGNEKGNGKVIDGVREWTISPICPIHANPFWWTKEGKR